MIASGLWVLRDWFENGGCYLYTFVCYVFVVLIVYVRNLS